RIRADAVYGYPPLLSVAIGDLYLSARHRGLDSHSVQYAWTLDVRFRSGTSVGQPRIHKILLHLWRGRRTPDGGAFTECNGADDWRIGRDLRHPPRVCIVVPEPNHLLDHFSD